MQSRVGIWTSLKERDVVSPAGTRAAFHVSDLPRLATYDRPLECDGAPDRPRPFSRHASARPRLVAEAASGRIAGFRNWDVKAAFASSIGPVVADVRRPPGPIARADVCRVPPFIIDVPESHLLIRSWLERQGAFQPRA